MACFLYLCPGVAAASPADSRRSGPAEREVDLLWQPPPRFQRKLVKRAEAVNGDVAELSCYVACTVRFETARALGGSVSGACRGNLVG
jgi:hypothetical protein